ncbi:hypothetical protein AMS68_000080 [Peltaster fructicola]|uniref:Eukaryotic mitochondrial regulator protein-domain-containing protein n=1 Tax=Peltaster fructicola TaxID=286661 RepID=A0A6H0XIK8_9PEZI|nr:hypothetical protein AMS68_000080 [Peltaster fructicola]
MLDWFKGPGENFKRPLPGSTNYMNAYNNRGELTRVSRAQQYRQDDEEMIRRKEVEDGIAEEEREERAELRKQESDARSGIPKERMGDRRPFPLNQFFVSESVLSEDMREEVYQQVVESKLDISTVSSMYGIDIRRVAAVVRLKTIEKQWQEEGKWLAKPYNDAVLAMLPITPFRSPDGKLVRHESINDLPVHAATRNQLFWPASESRTFTREDAAKAFSPGLLPADQRIPHPIMIEIEKMNIQGMPEEERRNILRAKEISKRTAQQEREDKQKRWEERTQRVVPGRRWDFKFQDISVEEAGPDGRGQNGVGLRYGYAHRDRKKGSIKIPTSVE